MTHDRDRPGSAPNGGASDPAGPIADRSAGSEMVERLEQELLLARERLEATTTELDRVSQELKSTNDKYEQQRVLLLELQHRIRNSLGIVRSIARRSAQTSTTVDEYAMHLDGRLNALARTQALAMRDPDIGLDLAYLVVEELLAYQAREGEQLHVSGPTIRLQPKSAETLALAVHELATNAVKYGALSKPGGQIDVMWRIEGRGSGASLVFSWTEKNGPKIERPPARRGFGSELLEQTLAFELKARAKLAYEASGLYCELVIPLGARVLQQPIPT